MWVSKHVLVSKLCHYSLNNNDLLSIERLETNFSSIWINTKPFWFKKKHFKCRLYEWQTILFWSQCVIHYEPRTVRFHFPNYNDVTMSAMASQITGVAIACSTVGSGADQRNIRVLRHWPLCGEFTGDRGIPRTMANNAENLSIWWRHNDMTTCSIGGLLINHVNQVN